MAGQEKFFAGVCRNTVFFFFKKCNLWRYNDVLLRCRELDSWTQDLSLPSVVWLSGLFNPQSFLTGNSQTHYIYPHNHFPSHTRGTLRNSCVVAVMQSLARKNEWPLDKMTLTVDVTKKFKEEFNQPAREGAYVYGLYMEGAKYTQPPNQSTDRLSLTNHSTGRTKSSNRRRYKPKVSIHRTDSADRAMWSNHRTYRTTLSNHRTD